MENPVITIGRKLKHTKLVSRYANLLHYRPGYVELDMKNFDTVEVDGFKFVMSDQVDSVLRVKGNPWFEGVRPTDTVLDIGANIGAITIPLAAIAHKVYAVEPVGLFVSQLEKNIKLNHLHNVTVLSIGMGKYENKAKIRFGNYQDNNCHLRPFGMIKKLIPRPIDFLKCDCEGAEWDIQPKELKGIRELRFEFHFRRGREQKDREILRKWYIWLKENGYKHAESMGGDPGPVMPISACLCLRASKK
jgi:FkbM family methyltransferase